MLITLTDTVYLASGGARDVYIHPNDINKCIKIQRVKGSQNYNEKKFHLSQKGTGFIPHYYGDISTNLGTGIVVELIRDFNGDISKSLSLCLSEGSITVSEAKKHVTNLGMFFSKNKLLIHDAGLQNILLKKSQNGRFTPILIDGFGAKSLSLKYQLRILFPFLAKRKTEKQISIMLATLSRQ